MLDTIVKAYDIRGVYPDQLTEEIAHKIGAAAAVHLRSLSDGVIVVGRDMRLSSPKLADCLIEGMTSTGANVVDVGRVDTPFVTFSINQLGAAGGVMVTASHNPPQYNGFKISGAKAKPIGITSGLGAIKQLAKDGVKANPGAAGTVEQRNLWDEYRKHVMQFLDAPAIKARPLRIVIDASNGMAGTMAPRLFCSDGAMQIEGLTIEELHFENESGVFAHEPNPLVAANLEDLQAAVRRSKADIGVCFDGDADRCVVVDERGEIVGCDHLTVWIAQEFLRTNPGAAIVYDLRSSKAVEEDVLKAGGKPIRGQVGHVFMKQALAEHNGVFGGELSGHFYFRDNFYADSGAIMLACVVGALSRSGKSMSENIKPIARYAQSGEINFEVEDKDAALAEVVEKYSKHGSIDTLDGVTVDCFASDGWWANIRKSNTEPLLRLNLEAKTEAQTQRMVDEISPLLGKRVDH